MPFCPKCRDEFQSWVKVCPDCKVKLVDKRPPSKKNKSIHNKKNNASDLGNLPKSVDDFYNQPGIRGF
jgi:hypothetical protein